MGLNQANAHQRAAYQIIEDPDMTFIAVEQAKVHVMLAIAEYLRLSIQPLMPGMVMGIGAIADLTDETVEEVERWAKEQPTFPQPVTYDRNDPLYERVEVHQWLGTIGWEPPEKKPETPDEWIEANAGRLGLIDEEEESDDTRGAPEPS